MAAIPPPSDNGSVVVRVPVPTQVASPAPPKPAPKPAAPRATFILPGGVTPTPTRPLKFARLVDTSRFAGPLDDTYLKHYGAESAKRAPRESDVFVGDRAENSFRTDPHHGVLADYLDENDDPRGDIVRGHVKYSKLFGDAWARAGGVVRQIPFGEEMRPRERGYPHGSEPGDIRLSDGTALMFRKYSRGGKEPVWIVQWTGPDNRVDYHTVMGHQQFKNWLRRFDKDELSRIVKGMRNGR